MAVFDTCLTILPVLWGEFPPRLDHATYSGPSLVSLLTSARSGLFGRATPSFLGASRCRPSEAMRGGTPCGEALGGRVDTRRAFGSVLHIASLTRGVIPSTRPARVPWRGDAARVPRDCEAAGSTGVSSRSYSSLAWACDRRACVCVDRRISGSVGFLW